MSIRTTATAGEAISIRAFGQPGAAPLQLAPVTPDNLAASLDAILLWAAPLLAAAEAVDDRRLLQACVDLLVAKTVRSAFPGQGAAAPAEIAA